MPKDQRDELDAELRKAFGAWAEKYGHGKEFSEIRESRPHRIRVWTEGETLRWEHAAADEIGRRSISAVEPSA